MDVLAKAVAAIEQADMLSPGGRVAVALSGGADSVALLHVLLALRDRLPEGYFLSENDRTMYRVLLQRGLSGQELDISALGENLSPQAVDRLAKWQLPGAPPVTDEEAEDCLKCLRDYAARMSRDELGQLSGEALRQYIENLNREKNRRKE